MEAYIVVLHKFLETETYEFKDGQLDELIEDMLENIGTLDPKVRDQLIYKGFVKLILGDYLTVEQTKYIVEKCLSNRFLFFDIEDKRESNSVFTRSFSALVLAAVLFKDTSDRKLSNESVVKVIEASLDYLLQEHDYRGFVERKGWAHSIAHGSDLLAYVVSHPLFSTSSIEKCLQVIRHCVLVEYAYIDEEDERLINVIQALIEIDLQDEVLSNWIESLQNQDENNHIRYRIGWNVKRFCNSLYMALLEQESFPETKKAIIKKYHQPI